MFSRGKATDTVSAPAIPKKDDRVDPAQKEQPVEMSSAAADQEQQKRKRRRRTETRAKGKARGSSTKPKKKHPRQLPVLVEIAPAEGKKRFADFDICKEVLGGIQDLKFEYCTPVQAECLPHALAGKDVTGKAQTGTGKTAAFLTAALNYLIRNPKKDRKPGSCRVLVLAPTRELAIQIHKDAEALGKYCGFTNLAVFGGMGYQEQLHALKKPIDIVVGTPGRILDYCSSKHLHFSKTEILVIDEADRMLDMGFIPDVRRIVRQFPPAGKRQTMFFSATLTGEIIRLVDRWLVNPVRVETESETVVTDLIEQKFYSVSRDDKLALILWLLRHEKVSRMLVFCNRKDSTQRVARSLQRHGINSGVLSGDIPQERRLRILERFRSGKTRVIVATDVAARGIHVENVSHVVLYDLPHDPEDYVHRIGRTGRAGETGKSIAFACEYGAYVIPELEQFLDSKIVCINPTEDMLSLPPLPPASPKTGKKTGKPRPRRSNRNRGRRRQKTAPVSQ